jgi:hypothetical protein
MCKTIREKMLEQIDLVEELQSVAGINIVNCGNCGSVLLHRLTPLAMDTPLEDYDITCPYCDFQSEPCDFPDFLYEGMEHSLITDIVLTTLRENDTLSIDQAKSVEDAIESGYISSSEIYEDFVEYVLETINSDRDIIEEDYKEHYQNLLSHKENLKIIQESFGSSEKSTIFTENLKPSIMELTKQHREALINELDKAKEEKELAELVIRNKTDDHLDGWHDIRLFMAQQKIKLIEQSLIDNQIDF